MMADRASPATIHGDLAVWATHHGDALIREQFVCLIVKAEAIEISPTQARQLAAALIGLAHQADGLTMG